MASIGENPPFETVRPDDHSAWIILSAAVGLSMILLFGCIRVFVRITLSHGFGRDDIFLLVATVVGIVQNALVLAAASTGLGRSFHTIPTSRQNEVQVMYYASNQLYGAALGFSKTSIFWILMRLTPIAEHRRVIKVMMGLLMAWQLAFIFSIAIQCNIAYPWILVGQKCPGILTRWEVLESTGLVFEVGAFAVAVWLVWDLQTDISNKFAVTSTFLFRPLIIIFVAFRLTSFDNKTLTTNPTLGLSAFIAWTSAEMNYSIVAATIPTLRPLIVNLVTHYGGGSIADTHTRENSYLVPYSPRTESKATGGTRDSTQGGRTSRPPLGEKRASAVSSKRASTHNPDGSFRGSTSYEISGGAGSERRESLSPVRDESRRADHDVEMQGRDGEGGENMAIRKGTSVVVQHDDASEEDE